MRQFCSDSPKRSNNAEQETQRLNQSNMSNIKLLEELFVKMFETQFEKWDILIEKQQKINLMLDKGQEMMHKMKKGEKKTCEIFPPHRKKQKRNIQGDKRF